MQQHCITREDPNDADHAHLVTSTCSLPLLKIQPEFASSVREKGKSSNSLAGIYMKQASGGAGDPAPNLPGAAAQPPCLHFAEGPPPTPSTLFFWLCQKNYFLATCMPKKNYFLALPKKNLFFGYAKMPKTSPGSSVEVGQYPDVIRY